MHYLNHHRERVDREEISTGTLKQMWQPVRKFADAFMDMRAVIDWKRIIESMPQAEDTADDRILTLEEIRKLVEHHDRRIKAIVSTVCTVV